jgi:hypothetical protein
MRMRWVIVTLYAIAVLVGVVSATCLVAQGGFGGGDGDWDSVLWALSLPWALIAWPDLIQNDDLVRLSVLPFVLNLLTITLIRVVVRRVHQVRDRS